MYRRPFIYIFLATILIFTIAFAESAESSSVKENDSNNTAISEKKPYSVSFLPDELSWRDGFGQALAVSGILISTLVVLGVFAWLLAPVFGYRLCTVLGNCEPSVVLAHSNNGGNLQDPGQANGYSDMYNSVVSPYMSAYRKRSLKYVGPLLKTLASAYEKFDQQQAVSPPSKSD
ncbi:hypothetical protein V9T40_010737 [Parthenolecanium corni]|uniref:Uncharacterized protein n=1 Tax=Parthenolecanium corni TaxID=536013 RepID=A0AAN9T5Q8_9HEMI